GDATPRAPPMGAAVSARLVFRLPVFLLGLASGLLRRLLHRIGLPVVLRLDRATLAIARAERDAPAARLGRRARDRHRQHAVAELGRAGLLVDVGRQRHAALETAVAALGIAALGLALAALLPREREHPVLDVERDVVLLHARQLRGEPDALVVLLDLELRPAGSGAEGLQRTAVEQVLEQSAHLPVEIERRRPGAERIAQRAAAPRG